LKANLIIYGAYFLYVIFLTCTFLFAPLFSHVKKFTFAMICAKNYKLKV